LTRAAHCEPRARAGQHPQLRGLSRSAMSGAVSPDWPGRHIAGFGS
jgi:hypothetical protein